MDSYVTHVSTANHTRTHTHTHTHNAQMFLIKHPKERAHISHPICLPASATALTASRTQVLSLSISLLELVIVHAGARERHWNRKVISTSFSSCFQGLKQHITFQMLPGRPDVSERRSDVYIQALSPRRPAALFVLDVCCASHPNHMQSCVFPGLLYVNSSHSLTLPHTETHTHTHAWVQMHTWPWE